MSDGDAKEVKIPLVLLLIGLGLVFVQAFFARGAESAADVLVESLVGLVLQVVIGVIALFVASIFLELSFGRLSTAILKLAAIFTLPAAVAGFIPIGIVAWVVSLLLYFGLLEYLFDELDGADTVWCAVIIFLTQAVVSMFIIGALVAANS